MTRAALISVAVVLAALAGCRSDPAEGEAASVAESGLGTIPVTIRTASGNHRFTAEVARSEEEQAQGLMFRDNLAPDAAMLFPFSPPRPASFWMENTAIPLDMIFVRADGSIAFIGVNAVPYSRERVGVTEPVAAVLEIAGGRSAELGITEGDRVGWPGGPAL